MNTLKAELSANFEEFADRLFPSLEQSYDSLASSKKVYERSYFLISSIQAWRSELEGHLSAGSFEFFVEAQYDLLASHADARLGSWRSALKALRSAIENVYFAMYYMDHPVEFQLWQLGKHKLGYSEMSNYFKAHPLNRGLSLTEQALANLDSEYATLSKAVHASAAGFRMSNTSSLVLWKDSTVELGKWHTREKEVIRSLNVLLISLFRHLIQGARLLGLRKSISLVQTTKHPLFRTEFGVSLVRP